MTNQEKLSSNANEDAPGTPAPSLPENWDRCHAFLENKRRFCRQVPRPPSVYCGNHQHLDSDKAGTTTTGRKRIPCPLDPSHLIFEDMIEHHILICPKVKKRKRQEQQPYFKACINSGGHGDLYVPKEQIPHTVEWAKYWALRVLEAYTAVFGTEKIKTKSLEQLSWDDLHSMIPTKDLSQPEIDAGMEQGFQQCRIKSGGARHIPQLASLVGNLRDIGVLPPLTSKFQTNQDYDSSKNAPLVLIEMGAGRGIFGLAASGVAASNKISTQLVMVERTGSRSKADKVFRSLHRATSSNKQEEQSYLKLDNVDWSRIECDLTHVSLSHVLQPSDNHSRDVTPRVVVIAKHLCGAGTDLALKSMEPIKERVGACLLATCCHGVCDWKEYVGRDYLHELMTSDKLPFGPDEFDLMRRWCAGAVACQSSLGQTDELKGEHSHPAHSLCSIPVGAAECRTTKSVSQDSLEQLPSEMNIGAMVKALKLDCGVQGLGRACQRLIDYGRVEYLNNILFGNIDPPLTATLCHYISPNVTPQNACIKFGGKSHEL